MSGRLALFQEQAEPRMSEVVDLERGFLIELTQIMDRVDLEDDEQFSRVLSVALKRCEISQIEFAKQFNVSKSTISRWRSGYSIPHVMMRKYLMDWVKQQVIKEYAAVSNESGVNHISVAR